MKLFTSLAFNIAKSYNSDSNHNIKRCQVLELISAYYGFNSFASLQSNEPSRSMLNAYQKAESAKLNCHNRAQKLNQTPKQADALVSIIHLELSQLNNFRVDQAIYCINQSFIENDSFSYQGIKTNSQELFQWVKSEAEQGSQLCKLLHYQWLESQFDKVRYSRGSKFWYKQHLIGEHLNSEQQKWAKAYEVYLRKLKQLEFFCSNTDLHELAKPKIESLISSDEPINLNSMGLITLSAENVKKCFSEPECKMIKSKSVKVDKILFDWDMLAALQCPSYELLRKVIYEVKSSALKWALFNFGVHHGVDITKNKSKKMEVNSGFQQVVEPPFFVITHGFEGIKLPTLNFEDNKVAQIYLSKMSEIHKTYLSFNSVK